MQIFLAAVLLTTAVPEALQPSNAPLDAQAVATCLDRVREFHGAAGPWAVVGKQTARIISDEKSVKTVPPIVTATASSVRWRCLRPPMPACRSCRSTTA